MSHHLGTICSAGARAGREAPSPLATKSDLAALAAHMERQLRVMAGVIVAGLAAIVGTAEAAIRFL